MVLAPDIPIEEWMYLDSSLLSLFVTDQITQHNMYLYSPFQFYRSRSTERQEPEWSGTLIILFITLSKSQLYSRWKIPRSAVPCGDHTINRCQLMTTIVDESTQNTTYNRHRPLPTWHSWKWRLFVSSRWWIKIWKDIRANTVTSLRRSKSGKGVDTMKMR